MLRGERYAHLVSRELETLCTAAETSFITSNTRHETDAYDRRKDVRFVRAIVLAGFAGIPALFFRRSPVIADPSRPRLRLAFPRTKSVEVETHPFPPSYQA